MKKIIIDNNLICDVLVETPDADLLILSEAVLLGKHYKVQLVLGGRLEEEYLLHKNRRGIYLELARAGRLQKYPKDIVCADEAVVAALNIKSDDPHVLALARVSGARVLCSLDKPLHDDFCNKTIIDNPRGKIWQNDAHKHLLRG
ncbi:MAG: hypothetical protein R3F03_11200 [Opitutaceae bacterium]